MWEELLGWVISSDLLPLNDPDIPPLLHCSSGSCSSPDISFAYSSLALSYSWESLQDNGSDHLPILLSVPLSPVFCPNTPSFNFQKVCWDDFASYFDSHCPSVEEYSSLSSAAALFSSLTLNAAKSSIPFDRIKCHPKAWWSAEMEEAVSERHKAFAAAHRSDEHHQAYIYTSRVLRLSLPRPRLRHGRQLALFFCLNLTLHINLCTLTFFLSLALLPPLLTSTTASLLPESRLQSSTITWTRGYLSKLHRATCPEESFSSFCCLFFHA